MLAPIIIPFMISCRLEVAVRTTGSQMSYKSMHVTNIKKENKCTSVLEWMEDIITEC